jgi:hypothetical protein
MSDMRRDNKWMSALIGLPLPLYKKSRNAFSYRSNLIEVGLTSPRR